MPEPVVCSGSRKLTAPNHGVGGHCHTASFLSKAFQESRHQLGRRPLRRAISKSALLAEATTLAGAAGRGTCLCPSFGVEFCTEYGVEQDF